MKNRCLFNTKNLSFLCVFMLFSCLDLNPYKIDLMGTWVIPISQGSEYKWGFTLLEEGEVKTINSKRIRYDSWEVEDNRLLLHGRNIEGNVSRNFMDTLEILTLNESNLIVHNRLGDTIRYARILNAAQIVHEFNKPNKCYRLSTNGDTVSISISHSQDQVKGSMEISSQGGENNTAFLIGDFVGDTLIWNVWMESDGEVSKSQVAFLRKENSLIQGFGEMNFVNGVFQFKNRKAIEFMPSMQLKRIFCSDSK